MLSFLISFAASVLAVFLTLWIERLRQPHLVAQCGPEADVIPDYEGHEAQHYGAVKFCRLLVSNKPFPLPFSWIPRQTAESCRATLEVHQDKKILFSYPGRWANTPELPHLTTDQWVLKVINPDPVTITTGDIEAQPLDVLIWHDKTHEAFAWNNESYLADWKNGRMKLPKGKYSLIVRISTQNGKNFSFNFKILVGTKLDDIAIVDA